MPELVDAEGKPTTRTPTGEDYATPQPLLIGSLALVAVALGRSRATDLAGAPGATLAGGAAALAIAALIEIKRAWTARIVERLASVQPDALAKADPGGFVVPGLGFWGLVGLLALVLVVAGVAVIVDRKSVVRTEGEATGALVS